MTTDEEIFNQDLRVVMQLESVWGPKHTAVRRRIEFLLDGKHYDDQIIDQLDLSSRTVRWVGQESIHVYRHELGVVTQPGQLIARPVEDEGDSDLADVALSLVENELENPMKEFEDTMEDVVGCAIAGGYGVAWWDFLPDEGPWGEIYAVCDDPTNFMADLRVRSINSPRCRYVVRKFRMTIKEAQRRAMKKGKGAWDKEAVDALLPDMGHNIQSLVQNTDSDAGELVYIGRGNTLEDAKDEQQFSGYMIWYRKDDTREVKNDYTWFEPNERYMRCTTCGYRSATQGELKQDLPEFLENGCPECNNAAEQQGMPLQSGQGDIERVDGKRLAQEILSYPNGRLAIIAPFSGKRLHLYNGQWPIKTRTFPCMFVSRFRHPLKMYGMSITDLNWWNQIAHDMLMRIVLERLLWTAPVWLLPDDGIKDIQGNKFELTDENGWNAYYDSSGPIPKLKLIGGDPGIPNAWNAVYAAARTGLTSHTGIADFGLGPGQSRNIPAASVSQQIQQEEIPQAHFKRRYQRQRSIFTGVLYDMIRATYPAERIYRLRAADGRDYIRAMAASDMPNYDFWFDSTPDMKPQDEREASALELLMNTIETRPYAVDAVASVNKISPTMVRKLKMAFQRQMEQQQQAKMQAEMEKEAKKGNKKRGGPVIQAQGLLDMIGPGAAMSGSRM